MTENQQADNHINGYQGYGLIQIFHGTGKGKTTAALGTALRCAGSGRRVAVVFFDKGGALHYSERKLLEFIGGIDYWATGRNRIDNETGRFDFSVTEIDKLEAMRGLEIAARALTNPEYSLVVLDEINSTVNLGMLELGRVLKVIDNKFSETELILTGRNPHQALLERAHLITEMKPERHYFYSGVKAREGLDY